MIYYTIYTSTPRDPITLESIKKISAVSKENNPSRGVTGMLLGIDNKYLQYLEGDQEAVETLFSTIKNDPRHGQVTQWVKGFSDERIFSEWSMGSWLLSNQQLEQLSALAELKAFLDAPENSELQAKRFLGMMHDLLSTWIAHESERLDRT